LAPDFETWDARNGAHGFLRPITELFRDVLNIRSQPGPTFSDCGDFAGRNPLLVDNFYFTASFVVGDFFRLVFQIAGRIALVNSRNPLRSGRISGLPGF